MTTPGFLLKIKVAAILEFGIVILGLYVNYVLKMGITLGGVVVDKIVNEDVGHGQNEDVEVNGKKDNRDKDNGNQTVDARLLDKIESDRGGVRKITDGLNGSVAFFSRFRLEVGKEIAVDFEANVGNFVFETTD